MQDNSNEAILRQVQQLFKSAMGDNVEVNIATEKDMIAEWDSVNHLNLVVELENEFDLGLSMTEIENLHSVKHIIELVNDKKQSGIK